MSKKKNNNYAFIDGQNLHKAVERFQWFLSYNKLFKLLESKFNVTEAYYFIGFTRDRNDILYKELRSAGFHLSLRKPITYKEKKCKDDCNLINTCPNYDPQEYDKIKANVDSNLIINAMIKFKEYDKAVIVAGDSDYYPLAKFLLRHDKLKRILLPSKLESSDMFKENTFTREKIEYISRKKKLLEN